MHMVDNMCKYGKPKEANTDVGEKNHKFFAKRIGCQCRKQHKSFSCQVSVGLSDSFLIEKLASAMGILTNKNEMHCTSFPNHQGNDNEEDTSFGATHCSLHLNGNNDVKIVWLLSTEKHLLTHDADVVTFLKENYMLIQNQKNQTLLH
jgi:hypothetical protein